VPRNPKSKARAKKDLVLVYSRTEDGDGVRVIRNRNEQLELGEMRPLQDGRPVQGEVVHLMPCPELPLLFDAETVLEAPAPANAPGSECAAQSSGPPQVASEAYRRHWDTIWRRRPRRQDLN
jgi:hypothetical protein